MRQSIAIGIVALVAVLGTVESTKLLLAPQPSQELPSQQPQQLPQAQQEIIEPQQQELNRQQDILLPGFQAQYFKQQDLQQQQPLQAAPVATGTKGLEQPLQPAPLQPGTIAYVFIRPTQAYEPPRTYLRNQPIGATKGAAAIRPLKPIRQIEAPVKGQEPRGVKTRRPLAPIREQPIAPTKGGERYNTRPAYLAPPSRQSTKGRYQLPARQTEQIEQQEHIPVQQPEQQEELEQHVEQQQEEIVQQHEEIPSQPQPSQPITAPQQPLYDYGSGKFLKLKSTLDKLKAKFTLGSTYVVTGEEIVTPGPAPAPQPLPDQVHEPIPDQEQEPIPEQEPYQEQLPEQEPEPLPQQQEQEQDQGFEQPEEQPRKLPQKEEDARLQLGGKGQRLEQQLPKGQQLAPAAAPAAPTSASADLDDGFKRREQGRLSGQQLNIATQQQLRQDESSKRQNRPTY